MHTIKLKDLQEYAESRGPLESMEALRMPWLGVSKVSLTEWEFIWTLVGAQEDTERTEPAGAHAELVRRQPGKNFEGSPEHVD